jgi:hypothetical protein
MKDNLMKNSNNNITQHTNRLSINLTSKIH